MDAEAGGAADLQTDVMRFMAIISMCLVAIFAIVQTIPLAPVIEQRPPEPITETLEIEEPVARLKRVSEILGREVELLQVQQKIQSDAKGEIDRSQRDYYLREQLKAIQKELGESDERGEEIAELKAKIEEAKMPEKVLKEAEKQLRRLEKMHPDSAEAGTIRTYIDWLVELPWAKATEDRLDIKKAKEVLDEDHYDLEKVKDRLLEYLAGEKLPGLEILKG